MAESKATEERPVEGKPPAQTNWIALTVVAAIVILFIVAYLNALR